MLWFAAAAFPPNDVARADDKPAVAKAAPTATVPSNRIFTPIGVRKKGTTDRLMINHAAELVATLAERGGKAIVTFNHVVRLNTAHVNSVLPAEFAPLVETADGTGFTFTLPAGRHISQDVDNTFLVIEIPAAGSVPIPQSGKSESVAEQVPPPPAAAVVPPTPLVPPPVPPVTPKIAPNSAVATPTVPSAPITPLPLPPPVPKPEVKTTAVATPAPSGGAAPSKAQPTSYASMINHAGGQGTQIRYADLGDGASVRFEWTLPTAAAVFKRGSFVWVVFDRAENFDFGQFQSAKYRGITSIDQLPNPGITVLRLGVSPEFSPAVRRAGNAWFVDLRPVPSRPDAPIVPEIHRSGEAQVTFAAMQASHHVMVSDPDSAVRLVIVPLPQLGQGIAEATDFADFQLLPTVQGIVLRPIADQLSVDESADAVTISTPGGLSISAEEDRNMPAALPKVNGTLLAPADWQGKTEVPYLERRAALLHKIITSADEDRTAARVAFARFLFANDMGPEALSVLRVAEKDVPNLTDDPSIRLLQGAAEEMSNQPDTAAVDLNDPATDGRADTSLWRAKLAADQSKWQDAASLAKQGLAALKTYPPALRRRLSLPLADAMFWSGDKDQAASLAADVMASGPTRGEQDYAMCLQGRIAADHNEIAKATELWEKVAKSPDIDLGRAEANFALAVTKYDKGQMTRSDAIAAIDGLRFAWRGDDFEGIVLRKLADLYAVDGNYKMAFETLQHITLAFPDSPAARDATAQMQKIFADIFVSPNNDNLAPLTSLSLYDQYKELTPPGPQGDAIIRKLADRLVAVDLLDRAGNLLEDQVKTRLTGVDQARVGAQLALVRLMDQRPADAIAVLNMPAPADLPADLARQRTELKARADAELNKPEDALQLIAADTSPDADRLRDEIYLKTQNWPQLSAVLQKSLPNPDNGGPLSPENGATLVRIATAMALGQDKAGLTALQKRYGARMDQTPSRDAFRVVAGDPGTPGTDDARTLADRVAQISDLQGFMTGYRQRLQQSNLSAIN